MPTTTFIPDTNKQSVQWNDPTRWSGGVVPGDPTVDVVIPTTTVVATGQPYRSIIEVSNSTSIKSLSISYNGLWVQGPFGLQNAQNPLLLSIANALVLNPGSYVQLDRQVPGPSVTVSAGSIENHGTITGTDGGGTVTTTGLFLNAGDLSGVSVTAGSLTNTGSFTAYGSGLTVNVTPGGFTNLSGSTLTGGSYSTARGEIFLNVGVVIATDAANISIDSLGAIYSFDDSSQSWVSIVSSLHSIAASGTLSLADQTDACGNLTVDGSLTLSRVVLNTTQLTVDTGGRVDGVGTITGPIIDNGTILVHSPNGIAIHTTDAFVLGPVSGSGFLEIGPAVDIFLNGQYAYTAGIPLELTGAASANVVFDDGHGTLILDDATHFTGTIRPTDTGDQIVVKGTSLAAVTSYDYVGDTHSGTLAVHTTGGEIDLHFLGNFARDDFSLTAGPQHLSTDPPSLLITQTDMGPQVQHDFNDDGKSDLLWQNDAGVVATWDMNDGTVTKGTSFGSVPSNWTIAGTGDFNNDHHTDILWRNSDGPVVIWDMNDDQILNTRSLGSVPANWHVAGTGDFNGDGTADILWRSDDGSIATWDLHDGQLVTANTLAVIPGDWKIAGTGDFNGDHKTDILLRNDDGRGSIWNMNDGTILSATSLGVIPNNWHIAGIGDFNGDRTTDILWRNDAGDVAIWDMHDSTILNARSLGNVPANWSVAGIGDFNGDQKADIVWRNSAGPVVIWDMDDGNIIASHDLGVVPANWHLIV